VQKWGINAVCIDCRTQKVTKLSIPKDTLFFGHSALTPDGEFCLISSINYSTSQGNILIYDTKTLQLVRIVPSHGACPHDIQLSLDQKSFFIMNTGYPPFANDLVEFRNLKYEMSSFAQFDAKTFEFIGSRQINHPYNNGEKSRPYGHFLNIDDKNFVCLGTSDKGLALSFLKNDRLTNLDQDPIGKKIYGEALTVRRLPGTKALITMPDCARAVVVDFQQEKVLKALHVTHARSLVSHPDNEHFLISTSYKHMPGFLVYEDSTQSLHTGVPALASFQQAVEGHTPQGRHATEIIWPFT